LRITALDKEAVGIVALGQRDQSSSDVSFPETAREVLRRVLTAAVDVGIKGYIDGSGSVAELPKLARIGWAPNEQVAL
jgi:ribose 5-phosphate isomerase RpiB